MYSSSTENPLPPEGTTQANPELAKKIMRSIGISVIVVGVLGLAVAWPLSSLLLPMFEQDQIAKTGIQASAVIVSIDPTGNVYNDQPQVLMKLHVTPTEGAVYDAELKTIINPVYIPQFQPGKVIKVRYDAKDRTKLAIDDSQ